MSKGTTEIGYLCHHGHYCFYADPDEGGACGSKRVGTVTLSFDDTDAPADWTEIVADAQASLAEKYETWRHCECDELRTRLAAVTATLRRAEAKVVELAAYGEKRYQQWQEAEASQRRQPETCPHCYEDVEHEDDHLMGDRDVNAWFECPTDQGRPVA